MSESISSPRYSIVLKRNHPTLNLNCRIAQCDGPEAMIRAHKAVMWLAAQDEAQAQLANGLGFSKSDTKMARRQDFHRRVSILFDLGLVCSNHLHQARRRPSAMKDTTMDLSTDLANEILQTVVEYGEATDTWAWNAAILATTKDQRLAEQKFKLKRKGLADREAAFETLQQLLKQVSE